MKCAVEIVAPLFDLALTLNCGQVFHWQPCGAGWLGAVGKEPCYIEQRGERLLIEGINVQKAQHYFALDHPLEAIYTSFPSDPAMDAALAACRGLRILRQPYWECVATFITSAQKAVPHIAQISHTLRRRYGQRLTHRGETLYSYPAPATLAVLDDAALRECALGYRAKNLLRSAQLVANGVVDLDALAKLNDAALLKALMRLAGVGPKVANCAMLFAYERLGAIPIDVWIERIMRTLYFARKRRVTARRLREFGATYFGPYGGYAQQYLFHHARQTSRRGGLHNAVEG